MPTRPSERIFWLALLVLFALFPLAFFPACSRLGPAGGVAKAASPDKGVPFHSDAGAESANPGDGARSSLSGNATESVPFHSTSSAHVLPAGTLITVRLELPLIGSEVHAGDAFTAVVAEAISVDGETVVGRGATARGVVEPAPESSGQRSPGYLRLRLSDLMIDGKLLRLQTSSLFAADTSQLSQGAARVAALSPVRLLKGRRLTFRLTAAAIVDSRDSLANR